MKKLLFCILLFTISTTVLGQIYSGIVMDKETNEPLKYVSIGIVGKDVGTVSNDDGSFSFEIDDQFSQDSLLFSYIGYEAQSRRIAALNKNKQEIIYLEPKSTLLSEVVVKPVIFKEKVLGNKYNGKIIKGGFRENNKGFECGVLLKIKKRAILEKFSCSIATCSYDSVLYRVNVYKEVEKESFENILDCPIYVKQKMDQSQRVLSVDLSPYDLVVEGNTLITLEHIADMGEGHLFFSSGLFKGSTCYYRKTSQGDWVKTPVKLGFNVTAKVEE